MASSLYRIDRAMQSMWLWGLGRAFNDVKSAEMIKRSAIVAITLQTYF